MKVLIVEDDLMVADLLEESLVEAGYDVCAIARSATVAVEKARAHRPDIAIIDINLGTGGLGTNIPRLIAPTWPMGFIFASGTGLVDQLGVGGATAAIVKPYSAADMITVLTIVSDIMTRGVTTRTLPHSARLLARAVMA